MNNIAVSLIQVSKMYKVYHKPIDKLKEVLWRGRKKFRKEFWALRDISLDIPQGSTFGIIGQNGSGKSTLLQIIAGILRINGGKLKVNGRISALLELGSGFNNEFTGRENVYMQGSIMGLSRAEMDSKFQQIADFADIGQFIEQPVKTYSSGMYVRLAFAVAINVDPDILIVDEALAVGDAMFQRRCYKWMEEFKKKGKTIIFVSHAISVVTELCDHVVLLEKGQIIQTGSPREVVNSYNKLLAEKEIEYLKRMKQRVNTTDDRLNNSNIQTTAETRFGTGDAQIIAFNILNKKREEVTILEHGQKYIFSFKSQFKKDIPEPIFGVSIYTLTGIYLSGTSTNTTNCLVSQAESSDEFTANFELVMNLNPGKYTCEANIATFSSSQRIFLDRRLDIASFSVVGKSLAYGLFDMDICIKVENS